MGKKNKNKNKKLKMPGFISLKNFGNQANISEFRRFSGTSTMTGGGTGFASSNISSTILRASTTEWAQYALRWTEYRIIRIKVHFVPYTGNVYQLVMFVDRSGVASISTMSAAWASNGAKIYNGTNNTMKCAVMSGLAQDLEEQNFAPVGTNSTTFSVQVACQGFTAAVLPLGALYYEFMVEFKGSQ